jgi:hypothetical protein
LGASPLKGRTTIPISAGGYTGIIRDSKVKYAYIPKGKRIYSQNREYLNRVHAQDSKARGKEEKLGFSTTWSTQRE